MTQYPENFRERVQARWGSLPQKNRVFFIHVPKTAGTAAKWYLDQRGIETYHNSDPHPFTFLAVEKVTSPINAHIDGKRVNLQVSETYPIRPGLFDSMLKFSLTRNPFDWLVSYYLHGTPETEDGWGNVNYIYGIRSFSEFVEKYCSPKIQWNHGLNSTYWNRMTYCQWFNQAGESVVDFAIRSENLAEGMNELLTAAGLVEGQLEHPPKTASNVSHKRKKRDYREYYDDASREIVEQYFSRELKIFGYDFNGVTDERIIYDIERMQLSYTYPNDLFMQEGIAINRG